MSKVDQITRESWILSTFPEWGTYLNEEIDQTVVQPGTFAMWWLGCTGIWVKSEGQANVCIDFWCGTGKRSRKKPYIDPQHQMARMAGGKMMQPNLRVTPFVLDPFAIEHLDAVLSTHYHNDHIDVNVAAAVLKNIAEPIPFVGPKYCVEKWIEWGVPAERCITVAPGDVVKVKDIEIIALESFDRTALITEPPAGSLAGRLPDDMDEKAVNYLIRTPGGSIYHSGDSHYSNYEIRIIQLAGYDTYYDPSTEETREHFLAGLVKSVEFASRSGIILGFETMETPFMNTVGKAMAIVDQIQSPYLQVYPDIGNLTNAALSSGTPVAVDLLSGKGHIAAVHLKETVPGLFREIPFGTGHVDFASLIPLAYSMGIRRYTAEFWHKGETDWQSQLRQTAEFLRAFFRKAVQAA